MYNFDAVREIDYIIDEIKKYFKKNGEHHKAVIGISGGKDSTITAALLVKALGSERVVGVLMPDGCQEDIKDSYRICEMLDIEHYEINIRKACSSLYHELLVSGEELNDIVVTNTPARIRMATLYMIAAVVGGRVINTCNFSEDYVGYSTKYGDLAGDFGVLKGYTVTEILAIGDALGLPEELVHKTPTDGMSGLTDEDNFGFTYEELDDYLLNGAIRDEKVMTNIEERHKRNIHKECIKIPYIIPRRCWWRKSYSESVGTICGYKKYW